MATICLIDDDDAFLYTSSKSIRIIDNNINLVSFESPINGLAFVQNNHHQVSEIPDIILLDINMPEMDGWEFLEAFEKFSRDLPKTVNIVMVTNSINEKDKIKAFAHPSVSDYLVKPLGFNEYEKIIAGNLDVDRIS